MKCSHPITPFLLRCSGWLLLLVSTSLTTLAQPTPKPLDSLIEQIPVMMRSDEAVARRMIAELDARSKAEAQPNGIAQAAFFKSWLSYRHDPPDSAIRRIDSALQHIQAIDQNKVVIKFYILKGQCYVKKTQFSAALENFKAALAAATRFGDNSSRTSTLISIGWAYMEDAKPKEAIRFFEEVLQLEPAPDYPNRPLLLCNIAACYNTIGNFKLAESFAKKGIEAARQNKTNTDLANGLNILGRSYYQQGKTALAIETLKEAATVREKVAEPSMLASDYLELADLYSKSNQPLAAISWAKKAEALSLQSDNSLKLTAVYESLANAYEAAGDHRNAALYLKKLLDHKASLADEKYSQAFAEMQVQYDLQKRAAENLKLKKENLEARLKNSNQQRWIILLIAGLVVLAALAVYISSYIKNRYKTRLALEQVAEQKQRTLAVMEAEEKERRRIAGDLHDAVGQTLAAASLQLAKARLEAQLLDKVDDLLQQATEEVRSLSHQVTPVLLQHYGLVKAMEEATARLNTAGDKVRFSLYTHVETEIANEMVALTIYRCFQELCTNALKHAAATEVMVQLSADGQEIQLLVEDNGKGFTHKKESYGLGMKNIESRLELFGGSLTIDSTPGKGTTTIIKVQQQLTAIA